MDLWYYGLKGGAMARKLKPETILKNFSRYLYGQRGLSSTTVHNHVSTIRRLFPAKCRSAGWQLLSRAPPIAIIESVTAWPRLLLPLLHERIPIRNCWGARWRASRVYPIRDVRPRVRHEKTASIYRCPLCIAGRTRRQHSVEMAIRRSLCSDAPP